MSSAFDWHQYLIEKKGISWQFSRTAGIPLNQKSLASGSAYRGSNPWGAANLESSIYKSMIS
ncbi:MAG: hypothetical protein DMG65_04680 [Candidatus Angelobacter sp. Gp1-AA117]|nr:MAG: hypothetical protein DMG65_04680 [Candidatus Angelobacter sp. Gp1-AA117]